MKKLTLFSIKSFWGPFVVTFAISMFMLIMQFTWKYIDDLMGKGLTVGVISELMFYVSASLIPLALPLAILLSSIMTFGNLAENNELTALKSSGLSLLRIMRPLIYVVFIIALATFYFSNYVIPVANLKWHSLIFDIQETKVSMLLTPGSYSKEIDGYAIKVENGNDQDFSGITIHDYTEPHILKTVKADSGTIFKSQRGDYLLFKLKGGKIYEELNAQAPLFQPDGKVFSGGGDFRPARFTTFDYATYKMDLMGFNLNRSDEDLFKDEYEMLNVFQLEDAMIATQKEADESFKNFRIQRKNERPFFMSNTYALTSANPKNPVIENLQAIPNRTLTLDSFSKQERIEAINTALVTLRNMKQNLEGQRVNTDVLREKTTKYLIEFHRKIALSATIIILFFVGAPLGAIVRKGGFGAPVVIAALLFMIYFVLFSIGENLAKTNTLSPFWGMWMPTLVLAPIAFILMMAAANDLKVGDPKLWRLILSFGRKR